MEKHNKFNKIEKTQERFGMYFLIFRISGINILPHTYPKIYMLYAICFFLCAHINVLAIILDVLQHTDDLQYCMGGVRALCAMITALWIHQFIRYCRTSTSNSIKYGMEHLYSLLKFGESPSTGCPTALRK
jgi:hypothetical protein